MKLAYKLFLSYLIVISVGAVVIAVSTAYTAPRTFTSHMQSMPMMMQPQHRAQTNEEIEVTFRDAVNESLLLSSMVAMLVAGAISWYVSQRITQPIRQIAKASQHIAAGNYNETIINNSHDELGELTRSFNRMAESLAETETLRQQLIADISHELKTPLATIKAYMEGLQDGLLPANEETYQAVYQEASRLQRLVRDLQELSTAEAGMLHLESQAVNLVGLVKDSAEWIRPQYEDQQVDLDVIVPDIPIQMQLDHDRLRQVLLNLLGNALQYTPMGGRVSIHLHVEDTAIQIAIQDSGVGLEAVDIQRIFQRFYRVDKSRARTSGGSGIGLTIAQHIVRAMGGDITATSAGLGLGSTFTISLPR